MTVSEPPTPPRSFWVAILVQPSDDVLFATEDDCWCRNVKRAAHFESRAATDAFIRINQLSGLARACHYTRG